VHLSRRAKIPGANGEAFAKAVETAKQGGPVSMVLNAKITLESVLDS
jgi:osmotically inducible protein OsmC